MEGYRFDFMELINKPAIVETFVDILLCVVPIWLAVMIGLVIGWSWRPRWSGILFLGLRSKLRFAWTAPPGFGARRLWLAFTALSAFSVGRRLWSDFRGRKLKNSSADPTPSSPESTLLLSVDSSSGEISPRVPIGVTSGSEHDVVTENDLEHLLQLLGNKDGDTTWQSMMERSTSNFTYQAWRHEPEVGPVVYRSRTIFEDATPELVRDFFWDDEFRPKWDPMLAHFKILEECPQTGTSIVHWIKKFPFFCSDREYIIGRRIWESGRAYYCVTKGVPYPALQRRDKPRRVDLYFSSWIIKPVQSRKPDGQACEVTLVHYEDMGIPKDVAKLGVRTGMWGTVKKLHGGLRSYQHARKSEPSISRSAQLAAITTRISFGGVDDSDESSETNPLERNNGDGSSRPGNQHGLDWKWLVLGGTVALVCGLHSGVIGRALLIGGAGAGQRAARR